MCVYSEAVLVCSAVVRACSVEVVASVSTLLMYENIRVKSIQGSHIGFAPQQSAGCEVMNNEEKYRYIER